MNADLERLALDLFDSGVVQIDLTEGLPTRNSGNTPLYFNFRTRNHPEGHGPLSDQLLKRLGTFLNHASRTKALPEGVPNAGVELAASMARARGTSASALLTKFRNEVTLPEEHRHTEGRNIVLVDDVTTSGASILDALRLLRDAGHTVLTATIIVDREQGGREELRQQECVLRSVFTLSGLLDLYLREGKIDRMAHARLKAKLKLTG